LSVQFSYVVLYAPLLLAGIGVCEAAAAA